MEQDKINAYLTLYNVLVTISKAAAPMIPFMTEDIYRNLVCSIDDTQPESVHLCDFPAVDESMICKELEAEMEEVLNAVVLGRACRNAANSKNRQPLGRMYIKADKSLSKFYIDIIADELNVKEVCFTDDVSAYTNYSFKPQLRTLGKRFGKQINTLKTVLAEIDGSAAMKEINEKGTLTVNIDGTDEVIDKEDLLIESIQSDGYVSDSYNGMTVVLDTNLTPELVEEGFVREIISKIQNMRKDAGFEVMDHINVYESGNDVIGDILQRNADFIKKEVLAESVDTTAVKGIVKEWSINGEKCSIGVERI